MTKEQLQAVQAAIGARAKVSEKINEYKEVLGMFKAAGIEWPSASKDTVKIVDGIVKATREDYGLINGLRDWYMEEEL